MTTNTIHELDEIGDHISSCIYIYGHLLSNYYSIQWLPSPGVH